MTTSVAVVVPTRNRADLAIAAIHSLLAIRQSRLRHVIVSNNSSEPHHVQKLEQFCRRSNDARLLHVRPPRALGMAEHWDWAIEEALVRSDATHIALHYDRRISRPDLAQVLDLSARWADVPITYALDVVYPLNGRFFVQQMPWSGAVYEIRTARALELAARGLLTDLWQAFPVLVNCVTPRTVIERVRARFGNVCNSTSPESCFGLRFAAVEERYLHFDKAAGIHYAMGRSNGMGYVRQDGSATFADFTKLWGDRPWLDAAPLPGVSLGQNSFYHEYALVRRQCGDAKLPPIEMKGYLEDLARGLNWIAEPAKRAEMRNLLIQHGWREQNADVPEKRADTLRGKFARFLIDHLPLARRSAASGYSRETTALHYAQKHPIPPVAHNDFIAPLQPLRVETE
ncbi:MAG: glycosyltransferase family 2 protein [Acidobacteriota bacterium]|nr:glycosyltransferase family 2 protein [Acidobacteriota bacterium]